jgi:glycosyltransferase involved in cell wall biosynthesis
MIRVAHVLNSPGRGGVPRVVEALVRHSDRTRLEPHVFYLKPGRDPGAAKGLDVPVRTASSASKAGAITDLLGYLDRHRIDVLHTHSFRPNLYARMAGAVLRPSGLRIVAHYHNDYDDKWDADLLRVERRLAAITDQGVAVSGAVAGHVAQRVGLACIVAENGIDRGRVCGGRRAEGRAKLGLQSKDQVVGLVGRLCRQKGVDVFVEAALGLAARLPRARFRVLGDVEDAALAAGLVARIEAAGLSGRIGFAGHREDMADMFAALDLLVAPSRGEGFGLMLAEAMAAGVPVVAARVGGMPDVLGDAGILVPPEDPAALGDAIAAVLADPSRRSAMIGRGLERSARFDWAATAERIMERYERVTGAA